MNNPYGKDKYALYPLPKHSAGGRLYAMMSAYEMLTMMSYRDNFDRRNLCRGKFLPVKARWQAALWHSEWSGSGRVVLLLGRDVANAFALPPRLLLPTVIDSVTYRQVPHPSGRNPWYNHGINRLLVGMLLSEIMEENLCRS
jgi:hypothetical protein